MKIYALYDTVSQEWGPPYLQKNHEVARRSYKRMMVENPTLNPVDFDLYQLGEFVADDSEKTPIRLTVAEKVETDE